MATSCKRQIVNRKIGVEIDTRGVDVRLLQLQSRRNYYKKYWKIEQLLIQGEFNKP